MFDNLDIKKSTPNDKTFNSLNFHDSKTSNDINLGSIAASSQPKGLNDVSCSICKFDLNTNIYTAYCGHRYHLQVNCIGLIYYDYYLMNFFPFDSAFVNISDLTNTVLNASKLSFQ